jgi:hypothetical protein
MPEQEPQAPKTDMAQEGVASYRFGTRPVLLTPGAPGFGGPVALVARWNVNWSGSANG